MSDVSDTNHDELDSEQEELESQKKNDSDVSAENEQKIEEPRVRSHHKGVRTKKKVTQKQSEASKNNVRKAIETKKKKHALRKQAEAETENTESTFFNDLTELEKLLKPNTSNQSREDRISELMIKRFEDHLTSIKSELNELKSGYGATSKRVEDLYKMKKMKREIKKEISDQRKHDTLQQPSVKKEKVIDDGMNELIQQMGIKLVTKR